MEPSRFARVVAPFVPLIVAFMAAESLPAITNETGSDLDCTNDFEERMFCQFTAQNCAEYGLTLQSNNGYGRKEDRFQPCGPGLCCCSAVVGGEMLISGDTLTATVWKEARVLESREVGVMESIKPKAPTIISLRESNGNFQLMWRTNTNSNYLDTTLSAIVTYAKKGSAEKVTKPVGSTTVNGLKYYEIPGRDLEPSTTYVVSVRSHISWSGKDSDSSQEEEFTTGVSSHRTLSAIIIILSVSAVMVTVIMSGGYIQVKRKWWDTVATSSPRSLHPSKIPNQTFKSEPPVTSFAKVHPAQDTESSSEECASESDCASVRPSIDSSALSYANTQPLTVQDSVHRALSKVFPGLGPASPAPGLAASDTSSGSSGMVNRSYSLLVPSGSQQEAAQAPAEVACVSAYHPSEGGVGKLLPGTCPLAMLPLVQTHLLTDSGLSSASTDWSLLTPASGGSNASTSCGSASTADPCCDEAVVCDANPCYAGSGSSPLVVDDYQAFQNIATQPDALGRPEPAGFPRSLLSGHCSGFQPLNLHTASQSPLVTHLGYQGM